MSITASALDSSKVTVPQISMNGSSRSSLLEQNRECKSKLDDAYQAMVEATPHGRDYQFDPAQYAIARAQHLARLAVLKDMMDDLDSIAGAIAEQ